VSEATVRDLRNQGGRVLDRVLGGERVTITRDGRSVARLEPVPRARLGSSTLVARFRNLPDVDLEWLRRDVDAHLDQRL